MGIQEILDKAIQDAIEKGELAARYPVFHLQALD